MNVREALRVALAALATNRLRSALSMFGILIGVAAVILLVAVGNGASIKISGQVQSLGSNLITVFPSARQGGGGVSLGFGTGRTLNNSDVKALQDRSQAPHISVAMPLTASDATTQYQNENWLTQIIGATEDYAGMQNRQMSVGSFLTDTDVRGSAKAVVLGQTVVDNLFGGDPAAAMGQTIKIQRQSFRVVGVFAPKGSSGFANPDNLVVIPITTHWNYLIGGNRKNINSIMVQATDADAVEAAQQEIIQILLDRRKLSDMAEANFEVLSQQQLLAQVRQITGILTVFLAAIAAISLVVGGIGIMNIMLVTVTERTREIGIRKAIGAKRKDVLMQFLIESMSLAGIGGLLGIAGGVGLSALAASIAARVGGGNFPAPVVSVPSVVLAFAVSVGIGLFFGIYPANRAARLRPIEALRYE